MEFNTSLQWTLHPTVYTGCEMEKLNCSQENLGMRATRSVHYLYIVVTLLGMLGNSLAIAVIMKSREMRKSPTNLLIINQSLIDLCTAIVGLLMMVFGNNLSSLSGTSLIITCYLWFSDYPFWSLLTSSSYSLMILSLERFLAINKPLYHRCHVTHTKVILFSLSAWMIGPMIQLGLVLPTTIIDDDGCCSDWDNFPSEINRYIFGITEFFFTFLVPFTVVTVCSALIYHRVKPGAAVDPATFEARRHSSLGGRRSSTLGGSGTSKRIAKLNLLKTLFVVVVAFCVCNAPRSITYLIYNLGERCTFSIEFFHYVTCCTYANCCVNPMVYVSQYKAYQDELKSWFGGVSAVTARRNRVIDSFKLSISS